MTLKDKYARVMDFFEATNPDAHTELHYNDAFQLLVAVMLSAQCTDKRVNMVTPSLFEAFPDAFAMAAASPEQIFEFVHSVSYPNSKSQHLFETSRKLVSDFEGKVPSDIEALQSLPGVGRKTANVVASVFFHKPVMPVDTHVFRVANRIGLTHNSTSPLATERQLVKYIPDDKMLLAHHWLILHGRYVCTARRPHCSDCGLVSLCSYAGTHQEVS